MPLHAAPLVTTLRFYPTEGGYERRDPIDTVATVLWIDAKTVYLLAMHGVMSLQYRRDIRDWFKAQGVTCVNAETNGRDVKWTLDRELRHLEASS